MCSVALLSSCWRVCRVFNTWYNFVWVFYDNTNLHPACCFMGTSVSGNSPPFCTPFPKPFFITVQNESLLFPMPVTLSWAPLPAQVPLSARAHPGFCHWALLAAAGLHGKESQNWFTHCVFYVWYTVCVLMAGNQQWGILVVTHRVGTAQDLTHRHPEPPVHWYNHRTPLPLSSLCRHCQCFPPSSPTRQFSMHPEFGNITLAELGDFFPEQKDKWGDLEIPLF